ncbi:hypothetical protein EC988_006105 [Linderina pennispora]|nr:hypothetical protein EC988_006105 [Linderina pennispora]
MKYEKVNNLGDIFEYSPEEYTQQVNYSTDDFHYLVPTYLRRQNTEESISDNGMNEMNEQQIGAPFQYIPGDRAGLLDSTGPFESNKRTLHGRRHSVTRLYRKVSGMFAPRKRFAAI